MAALASLSILGCVPEEGTPVRVALEVVGSPPAQGSSCSSREIRWLAKQVDGSDVTINVSAHGDMAAEVDPASQECLWRVGPATILTLGRYRLLATDGEWLAVCDDIFSVFIQEGTPRSYGPTVRAQLGAPNRNWMRSARGA